MNNAFDGSAGAYPAKYWRSGTDAGAVHCELCPHECEIPEGSTGLCRVRGNRDGKLFAESYGLMSAIALDPIEKKPLYRFHPGKKILSIGSFGCNLNCPFCQNAEIAADFDPSYAGGEFIPPELLVRAALKTVPENNIGVAYTYNEPVIGYEYILDCMRLVRGAGLYNVLVTNGYLNEVPLLALLPYTDAMNIDLKGFKESFYHKLGGRISPVKNTIALAHKHCHVEVTTLIIEGENDSREEIAGLAGFIASLNENIPLHLTRFFPRRAYSGRLPTPRGVIRDLSGIAGESLNHVFMGNMN